MKKREGLPSRLTQRELGEWRDRTLQDKQHGLCSLCLRPIAKGAACADHDHKTGHLRGVLCRGCNSLLGKIENNAPRYGLQQPALFTMLKQVEWYLSRDHGLNPVYPTHKTEDEKREKRNAQARARRAAKKGTV